MQMILHRQLHYLHNIIVLDKGSILIELISNLNRTFNLIKKHRRK